MIIDKGKKKVALETKKNTFFWGRLKKWHPAHKRKYPWIGEKDPYKIWLSEIILQQTRVEQGLPYYQSFLRHFPKINDLAEAEDQLVFRLWQGLGYYNRCKNMIKTARIVVSDYDGKFPDSYEEIIQLPGIGPYTAAAISSFAFHLPYAVVDGNVERFLSRYFGIKEAVNTTKGKKIFTEKATLLLPKDAPANFNQAMMDFGSLVCKPKNPNCTICPFNKECVAFNQGRINELPVKKKKKKVKKRYLNYYVLHYGEGIYVRKRPAGDIWQNLHEFLLLESQKTLSEKELLAADTFKKIAVSVSDISSTLFSSVFVHQLTHQKLYIRFLAVFLKKKPDLSEEYFLLKKEAQDHFAFPRPLVRYLEETIHKIEKNERSK